MVNFWAKPGAARADIIHSNGKFSAIFEGTRVAIQHPVATILIKKFGVMG